MLVKEIKDHFENILKLYGDRVEIVSCDPNGVEIPMDFQLSFDALNQQYSIVLQYKIPVATQLAAPTTESNTENSYRKLWTQLKKVIISKNSHGKNELLSAMTDLEIKEFVDGGVEEK
jgi:hypothetical protein